jgi:flagellar hook-basal body complex protein FliE
MDPIGAARMEIGRPLGVPGATEAMGGTANASTGAAGAPGMPFQALLQQAVETANALSLKSDAMNQALVQGKPVDLHRVVMAQQEAQISFDLVMQMRDKLVSAYQEILRMPL